MSVRSIINKLRDVVNGRKDTVTTLLEMKIQLKSLAVVTSGSVSGLNENEDDPDSTRYVVHGLINKIYDIGKHIDAVKTCNRYTGEFTDIIDETIEYANRVQNNCFNMSSSRRSDCDYVMYQILASSNLKRFYALYRRADAYIDEKIKTVKLK